MRKAALAASIAPKASLDSQVYKGTKTATWGSDRLLVPPVEEGLLVRMIGGDTKRATEDGNLDLSHPPDVEGHGT